MCFLNTHQKAFQARMISHKNGSFFQPILIKIQDTFYFMIFLGMKSEIQEAR